MESKKEKIKEKQLDDAKSDIFYIDNDIETYEISDFVRLIPSPRGLLLSFGQMNPDKGKFRIFKQILLPFEVAESLSVIIQKQIGELEKQGKIIRETNPKGSVADD